MVNSDYSDYLIDLIHDLVERKEYGRASAVADHLKSGKSKKEKKVNYAIHK